MSILWLQIIFLGCGCFVRCSMIEKLIEELELVIENAKEDISPPSDYPPQYNLYQEEEFDVVVVGGGSAGCVLANRLTEGEGEGGGRRVLLLEAGGDPPPDAEVPALYGALQMSPVDWNFTTEPQEDVFLSHVDGRCRWPRGKVLGGSSLLNFMWYVRGNTRDYDEWEAAGNEGWSYEDVLPYFKKSEDLRSPWVLRTKDALEFHSTGGYLTVENLLSVGNPLMRAFQRGFEEIGFPFNQDYCGKSQSGFARLLKTVRDHRRCDNAKAFLTPAKDRESLKVSKSSLVTKILIDNVTLTAYGVEFKNPCGDLVRVWAKKEVILSAGVINSPQLLMLSGIGPKDHLMDLGIPLIKDLPVGKDLQDHPMINFIFSLDQSPFKCSDLNTPSNASIRSTFEFLMKGRSSLSVSNGLECVAFINNSYPDGYSYLATSYTYFDKNQSKAIKDNYVTFDDEVIDQIVKLNGNHFIVSWYVILIRAFSRGEILLKDSNPKTYPRIKPGYFNDPRDMPMLLEAFDLFKKLAESKSVSGLGLKLFEFRIAACDKFGRSSQAYRECLIRHIVTTAYHPSSACGMGRVVDSSLKVKGVNRLRVVDASVMPQVPSANLNAPVTMIAEKAIDLIKCAWL